MSEGELHVPRLGHVVAAPGFRLVAAMNPFDAVGTARIASAVYDRVCRLAMGYQGPDEEAMIVVAAAPDAADAMGVDGVGRAVAMVRDSRDHPDLRTGSSVRGAIDFVMVAGELAELRGLAVLDPGVTLDAALLSMSGRIRLREGSGRSAEDVVTELWDRHFAPVDESDDGAAQPDGGGDGGSGKA